MKNETTQTVGPSRARTGEWMSKAWDWFLEDPWQQLLVGLLAVALLTFSQGLLYGPVVLGLAAVGLRKVRMERLEAADFFQGFKFFLPAFLSGLLVICFSIAGLIFLIVPGLVVFSMYLFTFHFIFDQGQDFWEAMESSRKLVSRDYFGFAFFAVLLLFLNFLGLLFFVVGSLATISISALAVTAAYLDFTDQSALEPAQEAEPVLIE